MAFSICAIRPLTRAGSEPDDGVLLPIPGEAPNSIVLEPRDGAEVRRLAAREIAVRAEGRRAPVLLADDVRAEVYVTDARIAVACSLYDTGGGWIGGPIALTLNIAGRVTAAKRCRGRMLVGHVRYPWLSGVYARNGGGLRRAPLLRLGVLAEQGELYLDVVPGRGEDPLLVATEIIRRAARFRLDHGAAATAAQRAELEDLAQLAPLQDTRGDRALAGRAFPNPWSPVRGAPRPESHEVAQRGRASVAAATPVPSPPVRPHPPAPAAGRDDVTIVLRRTQPRSQPQPSADDGDLEITLRPRRREGDDGPRDDDQAGPGAR